MYNNENKNKKKLILFGRFLTIQGMSEMAILIAMAIIFDQSFLKIRLGPGASISLTMLPLIIIALRFNFFDSFLGIGIVYGFITMVMDGYGFHTYPLDYLLGFGSISIVSLFKKLIFKQPNLLMKYVFLSVSVLVAVLGRITFSTISGMIFYYSELPFFTSLASSFTYNAPPMALSAAVNLGLLYILLPTLVRLNREIY